MTYGTEREHNKIDMETIKHDTNECRHLEFFNFH